MGREMQNDLFVHENQGVGAVFGRKHDINVVFEGDAAMTDGSTIILPSLSSDKTIDHETQRIVRGFLDHEAGHVRHSDMPLITEQCERWRSCGEQRKARLHNALEDIWLERRVIGEYPGAGENLRATARFANQKFLDALEAGKIDRRDLRSAMKVGWLAITWEGRLSYGGSTPAECMSHVAPSVAKLVREALKALDDCKSSADVIELTERTDAAFMEHDKIAKRGGLSGDEGDGVDEGEGEGESHTTSKRPGEGDISASHEGGADAPDDADDDADDGGDAPEGDGKEDESRERGKEPASRKTSGEREATDATEAVLTPEEMTPLEGLDMKEAVVAALDERDVVGKVGDYRVMSTASDMVFDPMKVTLSSCGQRLDASTGVEDYGSEERYAKVLERMQSEVNVVRRKLERALIAKQQRQWVGSLEEGRLDTRRFGAVLAGRRNVFKRRHDASELDTAVSILIDLSSSMTGERARMAMMSAIALSEALERTTVKYEVLGFSNNRAIRSAATSPSPGARRGAVKSSRLTGGGRDMGEFGYDRIEALDIPVFKGFDQRLFDRRPAMSAIDMSLGYNNSDACAVRRVWSGLRKRGESRKVLIVLSDGSPYSASSVVGGGRRQARALRDAVLEISKEGCFTAGIGIQIDAVKSFYPNYAVVNEISDLGGVALSMMAKALLGGRSALASHSLIEEAS